MDLKKLESRLEFAVQLAEQAGAQNMEYFRSSHLAVELKDNGTPVSEADRAAEQMVRDAIAKSYPGEGIIGEEDGVTGDLRCTWIIDPIDGTESFVRGVPLFGTLLAYEEEGEVLLGVAHLPGINETVYAAKGLGAWWKQGAQKSPSRARVSTTKNLSEAMVVYSSHSYFAKSNRLESFAKILAVTKDSRGWSDCYGHVLVATGRVDAAIDPVMEIWDCAPFRIIMEEAGGAYSTFQGTKSIREGNSISTNLALLDSILGLL